MSVIHFTYSCAKNIGTETIQFSYMRLFNIIFCRSFFNITALIY